ncbi:TackOD1 domain-containing metal-binding protein [Persephonella sp.]
MRLFIISELFDKPEKITKFSVLPDVGLENIKRSIDKYSLIMAFPDFDAVKSSLTEETGKAFLIYIYSADERFTQMQIKKVRTTFETSLSPLFVRLEIQKFLPAVDGVYKDYSPEIAEKSKTLWESIRRFSPNQYAVSMPESRQINYIRYLLSRGMEKEDPFIEKQSKTGFFYPVAHLILNSNLEGEEAEQLEVLATRKVLAKEVQNKTSLCPHCGYYNMVIREVCPSCGSVRIKLTEFIHHYSCGYTAPAEEFVLDDRLVCPKCGEELKHIGVDYDKPAENYVCEDCRSVFSEPDVNLLCLNCRENFPPEDILSEPVYSYSLTPFGKMVGYEGKFPISLLEELSVKLGITDYNVFSFLVDKFIKISTRYPERKFCILGIHFSMSDKAVIEFPVRVRTFLKDLIEIIKENIRESDIMSVYEEKLLFILLTETPPDGGKTVHDRLKNQIETILKKNNLDREISFSSSYRCLPDSTVKTAREVLQTIIEETEDGTAV